jgi:hypothetical protein
MSHHRASRRPTRAQLIWRRLTPLGWMTLGLTIALAARAFIAGLDLAARL